MKITPYIFVEECEQALEYYRNIFGGEITFTQKADDSDKLLHARIDFDDNYSLFLSDIFQEVDFGNNCTISFEFDSEDFIKRAYDLLCEEGTVIMELQNTFWGATFAMVKDKYNVIWQLNYAHNRE